VVKPGTGKLEYSGTPVARSSFAMTFVKLGADSSR
jgi:hypothetical protein